MSQISTAYDALNTRIAALLTSATRLPNPNKPDENAKLFLKNGYGVKIGPATSPRKHVGSQIALQREFSVVLVREFFALESSATGKSDMEKTLMEDQLTVLKDFEKNTTLNDVVTMTQYVSDTGIQYLLTETDRFIMVETNFLIDYFETL